MPRLNDEYYLGLEARLRELLKDASGIAAPDQLFEIEQFIEHSEYELALTWLAGSLLDDVAGAQDSVRRQIVEVANTMGISDELPAALREAGPEA